MNGKDVKGCRSINPSGYKIKIVIMKFWEHSLVPDISTADIVEKSPQDENFIPGRQRKPRHIGRPPALTCRGHEESEEVTSKTISEKIN